MNKIEANISLFAITFFAAIQYIFLAGVPADLSHFAFLCVTNLVGFILTFLFFFGELFRLDVKQIIQSAILSGELIGFNLFMLMGVGGIDPAVTSAVLSSYFVFIFIFEAVIYHKAPGKMSLVSVCSVLLGLFLTMNADIEGLLNIKILYLLVSNICFAVYVMNVGKYAASSNPSILAMGQMFFCFIFSLILWIGETIFIGGSFKLPANKDFWVGVIYISFFIRGIYGIIQVYAQRYVSPLNTSLIFSSEVVMTMLISPLLSRYFDISPDVITPLKIAGSVFMIFGLVLMEPDFIKTIKKILHLKIKLPEKHTSSNVRTSQIIFIIILVAVIYVIVDIPVLMTGFMPDYAGIKNVMPFVIGLFFGFPAVIGCWIGCFISSCFMGETFISMAWECWCIFIIGMCMYYGWHIFSKSHMIHFKKREHYVRYILLSLAASILCFRLAYIVSYFLTGILLGLPLSILFGSLLYVEPFVPWFAVMKYDAEFELENNGGSLDKANDFLQDTAMEKGINLKRVFELQSCLEELSIRIFHSIPDTKIEIKVIYYDAISMRLEYSGKKCNPFRINKGEDILDIMSLNIIKHRALRASFFYIEEKNKIHVVI